jgi:polyphosphate kinase
MTVSQFCSTLRPQICGKSLMSKAKTRVEVVEDALHAEALALAAEAASALGDGEIFATQESIVEPAIDPASPERFVNRELSWLTFNGRVLEEAQNRRHPVLERLRFLSISASNLDEFYMVRVAGLAGMVNEGVASLSADGLSPSEQLVRIAELAGKLMVDQQRVWVSLQAELRDAGICAIEPNELSAADKEWLDVYFRNQIFPVLTPLAIDSAPPLPIIPKIGV